MNVEGRVCVVTGGGRGIGRAVVRRLVARGAVVLAVARGEADLAVTASECAGLPGRCVPHAADLAAPPAVAAMIERCRRDFGRLDVLVNNAGTAPLSAVETMDDDSFRRLLAINVEAVFFACRAAWPLLRESHGAIVNVSSVAAVDPFPGFAAYGATKAWVNTFTRALAGEGRPVGIRVYAVAPGAVETRMLREAFPDYPAGQTLAPDDVAAMIEWLLDERCQHSTGQVIEVKP